MAKLTINTEMSQPGTQKISLGGSLDSNTAGELEAQINIVTPSTIHTVILDLESLSYVSSAGLRIIFKIRKLMKARDGKMLVVNLQPQVQKVFDIVKAVPLDSLFTSIQELDNYLDAMQNTEDHIN